MGTGVVGSLQSYRVVVIVSLGPTRPRVKFPLSQEACRVTLLLLYLFSWGDKVVSGAVRARLHPAHELNEDAVLHLKYILPSEG